MIFLIKIASIILIIKYTKSLSNFNFKSTAAQKKDLETKSENKFEDISKLQYNLGKFSFSLLPLSPESVGRRKTIFQEVLPDRIWTLDQIQGIIHVNGKYLSIKTCK